MVKLIITWIKSDIGYRRDNRRTLRALGFKRLNQNVIHNDCASVRGMVRKVRHLVKVEEKTDEAE